MAYSESSKQYYERNKDKLNAKAKAKYKKNAKQVCERQRLSAKSRFGRTKRNAEKRNIEFNINLKLFTELWEGREDECPILGIPLTHPSVDRIDNTKGYVEDNVQCVSARANNLKKDGTPLEHLQIAIHGFGLSETQIREMFESEINKLTHW